MAVYLPISSFFLFHHPSFSAPHKGSPNGFTNQSSVILSAEDCTKSRARMKWLPGGWIEAHQEGLCFILTLIHSLKILDEMPCSGRQGWVQVARTLVKRARERAKT